MPDEMVSFPIRGVEKLNEFLRELPRGGVRVALQAFTEYVIGNESHGLKHPDAYHYVSRKDAYGQTFASEAQRYKVMGMIASGEITPGEENRSGKSTDAWQYVQVDDWNYTVTNPEPGAYFTRDERGQAAQPAMVGWRKVTAVIADNMSGGLRAAVSALNDWLEANAK